VIEGYQALQRAFPNAQLILSTLDAFGDYLWGKKDELATWLPVVKNVEWGSTWYGLVDLFE
jgi:hypothetical protein